MAYRYLITSGSYSDYNVDYLMEVNHQVGEDEFRKYWLEATRQHSDWSDMMLREVANYLGIPKKQYVGDYRLFVSAEKYNEALKVIGYKFKGIMDFFVEILVKNGFVDIDFEECNVDEL